MVSQRKFREMSFLFCFFFSVDLFLLCVFLSPKLDLKKTDIHTFGNNEQTLFLLVITLKQTGKKKQMWRRRLRTMWQFKLERWDSSFRWSVTCFGKMMNERFKGWINGAFCVHLLFHQLLFHQTQNCRKMVFVVFIILKIKSFVWMVLCTSKDSSNNFYQMDLVLQPRLFKKVMLQSLIVVPTCPPTWNLTQPKDHDIRVWVFSLTHITYVIPKSLKINHWTIG